MINPKISIIVPFRNVENYFDPCLQSLSRLNESCAEFVLVNDGSEDGSLPIADRYLKADQRFRLITTEHVGAGQARNIGIENSRGHFIGFLDGDDILMPDQYSNALAALEESGSDFITCRFDRLRGREYLPSSLCRGHDQDRTSIRLEDKPDLVFAAVLWNKIFVRDFFISRCYPIPSGTSEDILPNLRAFSSSSKIDVFSYKVVRWRLRESGDSVSQRKFERQNILDRISAINACLDFLSDRPSRHREIFCMKVFHHDANILLKAMIDSKDPDVADHVRSLFIRLIKLNGRKAVPRKIRKIALA